MRFSDPFKAFDVYESHSKAHKRPVFGVRVLFH
jgi:hypothetical protein